VVNIHFFDKFIIALNFRFVIKHQLMYKDIISYKLANGISKEHLISTSKQVHKEWMSKQPGFIKWEITNDKEGNFIDIVYWKSKEAAQQAEKDMINIPNGNEWFACFETDSISSKNLTTLAEF
jgi:hypothetical protein